MSAEVKQGLELVDSAIDIVASEEKILKYWQEIKAFETSLKQSEGKPLYTFYDGPPFATGLPHHGHILAGTIKDIVTRYAHQTGHHVVRRFGWDCHGLPVEYEIDKKLGITSKADVLKLGIANYNKACREIVMRYSGEWRETVTRIGRWIDFDNDYKTLDPTFMESVWWVFKTIYDKDLVYQGYRVMPYSTVCGTPLSNFESGQNYQNVKDPAVVVSFPLVEDSKVSFLAWTTTPWTLPSNLALCVHPDLDYVKVQETKTGNLYIMGKSRLDYLFKKSGGKKKKKGKDKAPAPYTILEEFKGATLKGKKYVPLFDYFVEDQKERKATHTVLCDGYVTDDSGTGIVHQAPAFGEDDFRVCLEAGVIVRGGDLPCPVDDGGLFTDKVPEFKGVHVKKADRAIIRHLTAQGRLVDEKQYEHSYPHCWRSDSPLIYKAVPSWFINVPSIRDRLLVNNAQTTWVPNFVKEKRFHNWLANARDWNISRSRYWGTPIPIWMSEDGEKKVVMGSIQDLKDASGVQDITDLHMDSIDHITIPDPRGPEYPPMKRISDVFDCWFESGSMPYGQQHYPFENKERFEKAFPADFIAEGLDQTRGWFYTLMVISTAIFDKPPFKNLIVNGLVCAADGKKMSKRLKNYTSPTKIVDQFGADALRIYLINSPVVRADPMNFKDSGVFDVIKTVLIPWYNSYRIFVEQARRQGTETGKPFMYDAKVTDNLTNPMDVWILASLQSLIQFFRDEMAAYRLYTVIPRLLEFIDSLSRWFIRFNKDRIKGDSGTDACNQSLQTLFEVLFALCKLMAPFTPFFVERMYQNLKNCLPESEQVGSIHYLMIPEPSASKQDAKMERLVTGLQQIIEIGRKCREKSGVSWKIPLPSVTVCHREAAIIADAKELEGYILTELKVRSVSYSTDFASVAAFEAVPDRRKLGPILGKNMKATLKKLAALTQEELGAFDTSGVLNINVNNTDIKLTSADLKLSCQFKGDQKTYQAESRSGLMLMLKKDPDESCLAEGRARNFISGVQKARKQAKLIIEDKVVVFYEVKGEAPLTSATMSNQLDYISDGLRGTSVLPRADMPADATVHIQETVELDSESVDIWIVKA